MASAHAVSNKQQEANHAELLEHFKKLLCFQEALYDPITKKKLFIFNSGICLKRDCAATKDLQKAKVLIPESSHGQLTNKVSAAQQMAERVVCFAHFTIKDQKNYFIDGFFPPGTKMTQYEKSKPRIHESALINDISWVRLISSTFAKIYNAHQNVKLNYNNTNRSFLTTTKLKRNTFFQSKYPSLFPEDADEVYFMPKVVNGLLEILLPHKKRPLDPEVNILPR